jgi:hypothetical protein
MSSDIPFRQLNRLMASKSGTHKTFAAPELRLPLDNNEEVDNNEFERHLFTGDPGPIVMDFTYSDSHSDMHWAIITVRRL